MYHYYVRYSIYKEGKKVGDSFCECVKDKAITDMSDISEIENTIKAFLRNGSDISFTHVIIDFYHLLRKDPN